MYQKHKIGTGKKNDEKIFWRPENGGTMLPWTFPCNNQCTKKYDSIKHLPWRVFCKKGCDADGDTFEECMASCDEICYKDPVFKDKQWSAYIDRSPGSVGSSEECFYACVSGCGFKFDIHPDEVKQVRPNRPCKPPPVKKAPRAPIAPGAPTSTEDLPGTSA